MVRVTRNGADVIRVAAPRRDVSLPAGEEGSSRGSADAIDAFDNAARASRTAEALARVARQAPDALAEPMIQRLVQAVEQPRGSALAGAEGVLGLHQALWAARTLVALPEKTGEDFRSLLRQVGPVAGELEQGILLKALAARRRPLLSGDVVRADAALAELREFAAAIRGQQAEVLRARTTVVDLTDDAVPEGLQQRFTESCVPTVRQIAVAEADPVYAWSLTREPIHALASEGAIGAEQRRILEGADGVAIPRTAPKGIGEGMYLVDSLGAELGASTNCSYSEARFSTRSTRIEAMPKIRALLLDGLDVPVIVGPSREHCMIFTDARQSPEGDWQWLAQDPLEGTCSWLLEADIAQGCKPIGPYPSASVWAAYLPTSDE